MQTLPDTIDDAASLLALRAAELAAGAPRMSKEALDKTANLQHLGQQLGQWYQNLDPAAQQALIGAGAGAGLGLGASAFQDKERRHTFRNLLTGALGGAAVGGGMGLMRHRIPQLPAQFAPKTTFEGPDGKPMQLKPGARVTPAVATEHNRLRDNAHKGVLGRIPVLGPLLGLGLGAAEEGRTRIPTPLTRTGTVSSAGIKKLLGQAHLPQELPDNFNKDFTAFPAFRRSRLGEAAAEGGWLNRATRGRSAKAALPTVLRRGTPRAMTGAVLKGALPALALGLGENALRQWSDSGKYRNYLNQYAEPAGG